jgi:hypothetical protein
MAGNGGKRPGAGRKKGSLAPSTLLAIKSREEFAKKVEENLDVIFEALLSKVKDKDVSAIKELLDRAWGKSSQSLDLKNNGESFGIANIIIGLIDDKNKSSNKSNTKAV